MGVGEGGARGGKKTIGGDFMLLKINSKVPDWWIDDKTESAKEWWNELGWQNEHVPEKLMDSDLMCNGDSLVSEASCYLDSYSYTVLDAFGLEMPYKITSYLAETVREGFISEWHVIVDCILIMFI